MALITEVFVLDRHGKSAIAGISATRCEEHQKLDNHFYYKYKCNYDGITYKGTVLHNYDNGAIALLQKITKAIVSQQKANKNDKA